MPANNTGFEELIGAFRDRYVQYTHGDLLNLPYIWSPAFNNGDIKLGQDIELLHLIMLAGSSSFATSSAPASFLSPSTSFVL